MKLYKRISCLILISISMCSNLSCQNNTSFQKVEEFLNHFYKIGVNRAISSYTNQSTNDNFKNYYYKFYFGEKYSESIYKCESEHNYQIIEIDEFKYNIVLDGDTIQNILVVKENNDFKILLTHYQIAQLLLNEPNIYKNILSRMLFMCNNVHIRETLPDICEVSKIWFTNKFYKKYDDRLNYLYGQYYLGNDTIIPKLNESYEYLLKAYHKGYYKALDDLGFVSLMSGQENKFHTLCLEEANKGIPEAMYHLGEYYLNQYYNKEIDNTLLAIEWFKKAANKNIREAKIGLYNIYSRGLGVEKDEIEAQRWYKE